MNVAVGSVATRVEAASDASATAEAMPIWFGRDERPRFGWLHRPGAASAIGIVIVPPFGYEAICAHRSLRHLAEDAARSGVLAVRFDPDGCGDSAGDDLDPGRVDAWIASIGDACDVARGEGAERVVLVGVRLGALLALFAATRRADIAGIVAIALPASGAAFLREGRALQMALGLRPAPEGLPAIAGGVQEIVGFALGEETRARVSALAPEALDARPAARVLLLDRDDMPGNAAWAARLRTLGADVDERRAPGYVEMVLDAQNTQVPQAIIDETVAFALVQAGACASARPTPQASYSTVALLHESEQTIVEEAVTIDGRLRGIATRPVGGESQSALVLLNAGAVGRVGPNRLHVRLARRLAATGLLVLRIDQSGIGDSPTRPAAIENTVYSADALRDVAAAVGWARSAGARRVAVGGLCSGAYHALKAAIAGQSIDAIVVINPLTFAYKPGMPLDAAAFRTTAAAARYGSALRDASAWRKLLRGEVDVARVARTFARRAGAIARTRARDLLRVLRVPLRDDLAGDLLALVRRGVDVRFIFAADDPGRVMLAEEGGSSLRRLIAAGTVRVELIDGPDHTFTPRWSHEPLLDAIARAVQ